MTDEDNSSERTTNESDENGPGGEDVESHSPDSGTTVESTPDSSLDETSDSSLDETADSSEEAVSDSSGSTASDPDSSPEMDPSDSWDDSEESSSDLSTESAGSSSDSTIQVETPRAETATDTSSTLSDTRASVLAAASPSEEATLKRVRAVSKLLDEAFRIPGTNYRVGIDPILGILPVAGDALPTLLSFYPIVEAYRVGVPNRMLAKMLALVAIDATVGSIPVLGTLFDAVWKANKWNLQMLERHIEERASGN